MSRHSIPAINLDYEVIVGWDRPLQTFFGQVRDPMVDEEKEIIYWIGADYPGQIPEVADLVRAMMPYAEIVPAMQAALHQDKESNP